VSIEDNPSREPFEYIALRARNKRSTPFASHCFKYSVSCLSAGFHLDTSELDLVPSGTLPRLLFCPSALNLDLTEMESTIPLHQVFSALAARPWYVLTMCPQWQCVRAEGVFVLVACSRWCRVRHFSDM